MNSNNTVVKDGFKIFAELLISFVSSAFLLFFVLAMVLLPFAPSISLFLIAGGPIAIAMGLMGLTFFGFPIVLLGHFSGIRKKFYWVLLGAISGASSYILANEILSFSVNKIFIALSIILGAITGSELHSRLYDSLKENNGSSD